MALIMISHERVTCSFCRKRRYCPGCNAERALAGILAIDPPDCLSCGKVAFLPPYGHHLCRCRFIIDFLLGAPSAVFYEASVLAATR